MSQATAAHQLSPTVCPAWCLGDHLNDEIPDFEFSGTIHQRKVTVGDITVTIQESTDAEEGCNDPVGPVVTDLDCYWVSEESIRNLAAALNAAADLIGVPEVTA
jgi:hypothetical protein